MSWVYEIALRGAPQASEALRNLVFRPARARRSPRCPGCRAWISTRRPKARRTILTIVTGRAR